MDDQENGPMIRAAPDGPTLMQIADRVLGRPLLIHPTKAEVILHVLQGRLPLDGAQAAPLGPEANRFAGNALTRREMTVRQDGTAIISVIGSLVNRGAWIGARSGMTSYEGLAAQLSDAMSDRKVEQVVLDLDSPGGEATGMFALAAQIREASRTKPVIAVVNDMAASAAYGLASQATEIVVSPTSMVGSIGVVLTHLDRSGELAQKGIKPTLIYAGRHKVDGNPFGPLSDTVMADLQMEVAKFYDQFVGLVAQGRGERLTEQDARATEARVFLGQEAIDRGLADRIGTFDAVLSELSNRGAKAASSSSRKGMSMSGNTGAAAPQAENAGITQAQMDAAVATARAEGAKAERTRIGAILTHAEAEGRTKLATSLAIETDLSAEQAGKVLAASPKEGAPQASIPTIAQRAAAEAEIGASAPQASSAAEKSRAGWAAAVKNANASIGADRK